MNATTPRTRTRNIVLTVLVILGAFAAWFAWYYFFREVSDPPFEADKENGHSAEDMRFLYGSIGGEHDAGIPYWIVYVLPRVFPEKLPHQRLCVNGRCKEVPGSGGFAAFGLSWEQGKDLPVGFTTKTIGFKRVAQNCAVCHTASYRTKVNQNPIYVPTGPAHTFNLEAFFRFTVDCAKDPRFNSTTLMAQIEQNRPKEMTWIERQIYRFILIPAAKKALLDQEKRFAWIYQHGLPKWPDWGRGRDDAMNLTKYFLTSAPLDDTLGPTDMPSIWNIGKYKSHDDQYKGHETRMNFAGDSYDANSVIIDSALGLVRAQPPSNEKFLDQVQWLNDYLDAYRPPKFPEEPSPSPFFIDRTKAAAGEKVFDANCKSCHSSELTGTVVPVPKLGKNEVCNPLKQLCTDRERIESWNRSAAVKANEEVKGFDIKRRGLVEADPTGYVAAFLDGIWLRAPYLHNGSVPTLRDLLKPPCPDRYVQCAGGRPVKFYRGYDLYDPFNAGFVSTEQQVIDLALQQKLTNDVRRQIWEDMMRVGTEYDVSWRSNGNQGHEYGVNLPQADKDALIEYLKTL